MPSSFKGPVSGVSTSGGIGTRDAACCAIQCATPHPTHYIMLCANAKTQFLADLLHYSLVDRTPPHPPPFCNMYGPLCTLQSVILDLRGDTPFQNRFGRGKKLLPF